LIARLLDWGYSNSFTAGLISAKKVPYAAVLVGLLIPITFLFHKLCKRCFAKHDLFIPLERVELERKEEEISIKSNVLHEPIHVKIIDNEGDDRESSNESYLPPAISQDLPKVWVPEYIAHLQDNLSRRRDSLALAIPVDEELDQPSGWVSESDLLNYG
jgi:hypothetical protein